MDSVLEFSRADWLSNDGVTYSFISRARERKKVSRDPSWKILLGVAAVCVGVTASTVAIGAQLLEVTRSQSTIKAASLKDLPAPDVGLSGDLRAKLARIALNGAMGPVEKDRQVDPASLRAAERIVDLLPPMDVTSKVGLDDEGCVYFHFAAGLTHAYLTVEPRMLHLLVRERGHEARRLDNVSFEGDVLPERVRRVLQQGLRA
jgi:hypothetical protein